MRLSQRISKKTFPLRWRLNKFLRPRICMGGPPSGIFSEKEMLLTGIVEGNIVRTQPVALDIPDQSEIVDAGLSQHQYRNWQSLWSRRDDTFLASPSLTHVDDEGRVCLEALYGPQAWADPVWKRNGKQHVRKLEGDVTSIVSRWNDGTNYFHWFLDGLSRLIHLESFPSDCQILVPPNLPSFAQRSIELLGLTNRTIHTKEEDLRIERYWFAGPSMISGCPDPVGVSWLRRQFLKTPKTKAHRLLYFERNAPTRTLKNSKEVRSFFKIHGWEILDPGALTLDEQIAIMQQARAVVSVHGAALTNLLWAPEGTHVLELMPSRRRNGCYAGISLAAKHIHQALVYPSNREGEMTAILPPIAQWIAQVVE